MVYKSSQEARFATTVAIDKDRNSQHAVKWTLDNLPLGIREIVLVHVHTKLQNRRYLSPSFCSSKVIDGERANEYRRKLLPTYKAHRKKLLGSTSKRFTAVERSHKLILDVLKKCNVPVVKLESHEADDVVATLVGQVLQKGFRVVIASPDKDFKQLISEDAQIVVRAKEVVLICPDITSALVEYVNGNAICSIVLGAANRNAIKTNTGSSSPPVRLLHRRRLLVFSIGEDRPYEPVFVNVMAIPKTHHDSSEKISPPEATKHQLGSINEVGGQKPTRKQEKFVLPDLKICSDEKHGLPAPNQSPKYNFKHIGIIREEVTGKILTGEDDEIPLPEKFCWSPV
nr:5'-3' exonuclease [Ipomoea batatas]